MRQYLKQYTIVLTLIITILTAGCDPNQFEPAPTEQQIDYMDVDDTEPNQESGEATAPAPQGGITIEETIIL